MKGFFLVFLACLATVVYMLPMTKADRQLQHFMQDDQSTPNNYMGRGRNYGTWGRSYPLGPSSEPTGPRSDPLGARSDPPGPRSDPPGPRSHEAKPIEDLSELILDYANMIRDNIILLDNSMMSRAQKRVRNINTYAIRDDPACCKSFKGVLHLGSDYFPKSLENCNCGIGSCPSSYRCKEKHYPITVYKTRLDNDDDSQIETPEELWERWSVQQVNVTIGCVCVSSHLD